MASSLEASADAASSDRAYLASTAHAIALSRHIVSVRYPGYFNDHYASRFFSPPGSAPPPPPTSSSFEVVSPPLDESRVQLSPPSLLRRVANRTLFFDAFVSDAMSPRCGCRQLLLLGAGLDCRFFRLPVFGGRGGGADDGREEDSRPTTADDFKVFEIDQPEVIRYKNSVLPPSCVPRRGRLVRLSADLSSPDWPSVLYSHGFDRTLPTCIIAEGLLYYFSPAAALSCLSLCRSLLVPASPSCPPPLTALCFSAVSSSSSSSSSSKAGPSSKFTWLDDDPSTTATSSCGWPFSRAYKLGDLEGGGASFEEYVELTSSLALGGDGGHAVLSEAEAAEEKGGREKGERGGGGSTFWVVAHSSSDAARPFLPLDVPLPPPLSLLPRSFVVVLAGDDGAMSQRRIPSALSSLVSRAIQLCRSLPGSCVVLSGSQTTVALLLAAGEQQQLGGRGGGKGGGSLMAVGPGAETLIEAVCGMVRSDGCENGEVREVRIVVVTNVGKQGRDFSEIQTRAAEESSREDNNVSISVERFESFHACPLTY